MKIRLMTFHTPKNYGAVLQAYSLMSYLNKFSDDVKIIDYNTPELRAKYPIIPKSKNFKQFAAKMIMLPLYIGKKNKYEKFDCFVKNKLNLTERYENLSALTSSRIEADTVITGSDQVFNPTRISDERKAFYLDFVPNGIKRVSYAASFGVKSIPDEKYDEIANYLKKLDLISVRESAGIDIVKDLSGKKATEVLDPVFLNDKIFWSNTAKPYKKNFENYLFYYRLMNSADSDRTARKIAKEKNLRLVVMTDGLLKWKADKVLRDVGPDEFLYLTQFADYVVTDSFHGVAFSLIFEKQFAFSDINPATNERGLNLLKNAGIDRIAFCSAPEFSTELNYSKINARLSALIIKSQNFLEKALGGTDID